MQRRVERNSGAAQDARRQAEPTAERDAHREQPC